MIKNKKFYEAKNFGIFNLFDIMNIGPVTHNNDNVSFSINLKGNVFLNYYEKTGDKSISDLYNEAEKIRNGIVEAWINLI